MTEPSDSLRARFGFLVPLNKLAPEYQNRLLAEAEVLELRRKATLFRQGDRDDFTFYVLEGDIEMYADGSLIKRVSGGEGASFQPLGQLQPRQMTALAKTRARVLRVRRSLLDRLLSLEPAAAAPALHAGVEVEELESSRARDWLVSLLQSELFTRIPPPNIQVLLDTLESISVEKGALVVEQGQPGDYYYAVQSGSCEVVRQGKHRGEIRLAELGPGDTFGEEALIYGATRNATVRMTSDGELARLTKDDFVRLIKAPLLQAVDRAGAERCIREGGRWLDVRFEDEHAHNGLPRSLNIPLGILRTRMDELTPGTRYVAYCDSGGRSSAAAFLLAEKGFDVCYVEGGAVDDAAAESAPATATPAADSMLETRARASSLGAEVEKAGLTIAQAQQLMAQAEAMKAEAERIVAQKLDRERARLAREFDQLRCRLVAAEDLRNSLTEQQQAAAEATERQLREAQQRAAELERAAHARLQAQQRKIEQEAAVLQRKLAEAERLRQALAQQQQAAELDAARQQEEIEKRADALEQEAHRRLQEEKQRLEALYHKQAEQLESLQTDREAELRERLRSELAAERTRFETAVARTTDELEKARDERAAALAARAATEAEAQRIIAEFKARQQAMLAQQQAMLSAEREKLRTEAERINTLRQEAARARQEAEAAKAAAERELAEARSRRAQAADVSAYEDRASAAGRGLAQALEAESALAVAAEQHEDALERTHSTANEINLLLQKELDEWVGEQERLQESTLQRDILSRQQQMIERIRTRAAAEKARASAHTRSLIDEIQEQLGGG